jgi:hypothetical protein
VDAQKYKINELKFSNELRGSKIILSHNPFEKEEENIENNKKLPNHHFN